MKVLILDKVNEISAKIIKNAGFEAVVMPSQTEDALCGIINDYDAVITGQRITDSLGCFKKHVVNRNEYYLLQAPEAFRFKILYENFDMNSDITATNQQLPETAKLYVNFNFEDNYKITYHNDLKYCEDLLKGKNCNEI